LGIDTVKPGYKEFRFAPLIGEGIDYAKGHTLTPYGEIKASWKKNGTGVDYSIDVPVSTTCYLKIGRTELTLTSGHHEGRAN
jgi:alpha-L-rhamnosidase